MSNKTDYEYGLIQYIKPLSFEKINIGVILKDKNRISYRLIDDMQTIAYSFNIIEHEALNYALNNFRRKFKTKPFLKNYQICNSIKVMIPEFPFFNTDKDFDNALEELWNDCVNILRIEQNYNSEDIIQRLETGKIRFNDDWTGIFLRGDNVVGYKIALKTLMDSNDKKIIDLCKIQLSSLLEIFSETVDKG